MSFVARFQSLLVSAQSLYFRCEVNGYSRELHWRDLIANCWDRHVRSGKSARCGRRCSIGKINRGSRVHTERHPDSQSLRKKARPVTLGWSRLDMTLQRMLHVCLSAGTLANMQVRSDLQSWTDQVAPTSKDKSNVACVMQELVCSIKQDTTRQDLDAKGHSVLEIALCSRGLSIGIAVGSSTQIA
eukprot:5536769-Amphidinium_carterae.1